MAYVVSALVLMVYITKTRMSESVLTTLQLA